MSDDARAEIRSGWPVADGLGHVEVTVICPWGDLEEAGDLVSKVVAKYEFAEASTNYGHKPRVVA